MNVTRKQQRVIQRALDEWQAAGALSHAESQRLAATLRVSAFDWQRLSRYAFWTALACLLIALGSLFADSELIAWLTDLFSDSALARIALPAAVALVCYLWGFRRQRRASRWHYSTEAILFVGVVFTALALWQLGVRLDDGSGHIAPLFLAGCYLWRYRPGGPFRAGVAVLPAGAGQLVRRTNRLCVGVGGLLAGHELSGSFCAVRRRAAGTLFYAAKVAASASAVYRQ
jgi:hypothetical protein